MSQTKRSTNFTKSEEDLLIKLVIPKKHILENKKTDGITSREKQIAWEKVAQQFNAHSSDNNIRTAKVLKEKYSNIKRSLRKRKGDNCRNLFLTSTDLEEDMIEYLNDKEDTQHDADISANYLVSTSMRTDEDGNGTLSPKDWKKSKPNDLLNRKTQKREKVTDIENLKKQILQQQLDHARLEHELKLETIRLEHEQRMIQSEEIHKIKIKILETDLMSKELQITKIE